MNTNIEEALQQIANELKIIRANQAYLEAVLDATLMKTQGEMTKSHQAIGNEARKKILNG